MQHLHIITSKDVEKLKQLARKLKRDESIPHHEALDQVAINAGLHNWHHVRESAKVFEPTETALRTGCMIAMDVKDAFEFDDSDGTFVEDGNAFALCRHDLFDHLANSIDEEDPEGRPHKEILSFEELSEWANDDLMNYTFFRLRPETRADSIDQVVQLIKERSFWQPEFIWLKGKFYDTYGIPATDSDGNVVGVRF